MPDPHDPRQRPSRIAWPPILFAAAVLGPWAIDAVWPLPWPGLPERLTTGLGHLVGWSGVALVFWAAITMIRAGTTVRPDAGVTVLVARGPYRYTRNPMYVSEVMMLLGLALYFQNLWFVAAAALFAVLVHRLAVLPEEAHLEARFGAAYLDYKARTRRWI